MRRVSGLLALMLAFSLVHAPHALADDQSDGLGGSGRGVVQTGHPSSFIIGVTEAEFRVNKCSATLASQGVDALVADIGSPKYFSVRAYLLDITGPYPVGSYTGMYSNQSFYSASCTWLHTAYMRPNKSTTSVPAGTKWVVVAFPYGSRIGLEWRAGDTASECAFGY